MNKIENNVNESFKKLFFPEYKNIVYDNILITTTGKYSVTDNNGSTLLVWLIKKYFKSSNIIITDATANCGSDTIALAIKFKFVNSIELDKINFSALLNNVNSVYKLNNVKFFNKDSLKIIPRLSNTQ